MEACDEVDVSFDKVSLVGRCDDPSEMVSWLRARKYRTMPGIRVPSSDGRDTVLWRWIDPEGLGVFASLRCVDKGDLNERWEPSYEDNAAYRLEWNPNRVDPGPLVWWFDKPRATRLDVALDYPGVDLEDFTFSRPRCSASRFYDAAARSEGVMLGRRRSDRHIVVYDKAAELGLENTVLTRFEMRKRIKPADAPLPDDLFAGVSATRRRIPSGVPTREAAYLSLMIHEPEVFRRCDRDTRKKYAVLALSLCGELSPSPESVYLSRHSDLKEWHHAMLAGTRPPICKVYREAAEKEVGAGGSSSDAPGGCL